MLNFIADAASFFSGVLYVLIAFVIFMVMIMIHELGHYTAGKLLKFKINEFAIGMGPKIFSKTIGAGTYFISDGHCFRTGRFSGIE